MNRQESDDARSGAISVGIYGGGIYYKITEGIQDSGSYIRHDVEAKLGNSCGMFRADFGNQLGQLKDVHQQMVHGMDNLAIAVDTRLVQNDKRSNLQEVSFGELCATLTSLIAKLDKYAQDTRQMNQNIHRHATKNGRNE